MANYSKNDVTKMVKEQDVKFIRLQFTDIFGTLKNIAITASQLEKALDNQMMFDGSSIEGFVRIEESDMYLRPDPNTFVIFPWRPQTGKVARMICDVYKSDGTPFEGDPRYILKKVIKEAKELGYDGFNVGPECEFFLFLKDEEGNPTTITHDSAGYFDMGPIDLGENARRDISLALEEMGFEIEASHHEVAEGQHEIDFKYGNALKIADDILTFKLVVKSIAFRHGLHATFMPKPIYGINGSGMHINMSLSKDGGNAFYDASNDLGLSQDAYHFIAGITKHIKFITAVTNPLVNSYKRLVPGYEAPCYIAWSASNRSALIRVPASRGTGTRIELRNPDPACNPYLALALSLAAGLDGIKNKLTPPDQIVDKSIFKMTAKEREESGIDSLAGNLYDAVLEMQKSTLAKDTLGEHVYEKYSEAKMKEWDDYKARVHQWEVDNYISKY